MKSMMLKDLLLKVICKPVGRVQHDQLVLDVPSAVPMRVLLELEYQPVPVSVPFYQ